MYRWIVSGYHIKKEEEEEKECAVSFGWRVPGGRVDVKDAGQWVWESQRRIVSNDECATVRFSGVGCVQILDSQRLSPATKRVVPELCILA